jgi:hypothetical protein
MNQPTAYETVIFGTLTQRNANLRQIWLGRAGATHIQELSLFCLRASLRLRCHVRFDIGWEAYGPGAQMRGFHLDSKNQHSHLLMQVPREELETYSENKERFNPRIAWSWKQFKWETYDPSKGNAWDYVTLKHQHLWTIKCPGHGPDRNRCRRGCPYKLEANLLTRAATHTKKY